jgi:hypothetical protein
MLAGGIVSIGVQVIATIELLGATVLRDYAAVVMRFAELRALLEPRPDQMHSISAVTNRLSTEWGMVFWALLSVLVIIQTIRVWRSSAPLALRTAVLVVASVLVNPHVFVYDAVVLAPAVIWLAAWTYGDERLSRRTRAVFAWGVYGLYPSLLVPTAALVAIQLSVLVLAGLFIVLSSEMIRSQENATDTLVAVPSRS